MAKPTSRLDVRGGDMASHAALRVRRHPRRAVALAAVTATLCATGVTTAFASASPSVPSSGGTVRLIVQTAKGLSATQRSAVVGRNGGTHKRDMTDLRAQVIDVPASDLSAYLNRYKHDSSVTNVEVDQTRKVAAAPNDPSYADQWALPKVSWDTARDAVTPAGSSTIAVVDTGVDASVADLSSQLAPGWSAFGTDPTVDPNGHGTWVSSIAAAATDNGSGIAGVDYAGAAVMPIQALDASGQGQDSDIVAGVTYAADHGADVILLAFSNPGFSQALQDAVSYAWSKGAVVVAAVGNDGSSTATYPAGDANVMGVSATDSSDALWSSSNYGDDAFIAAPGVSVLADAVGGGTVPVSGTSASAAMVAGAAALLKANDASATNGVIVGRLARNANAAGIAAETGNGRLNVDRALADTSTTEISPAGAAPSGSGGPLVGPYVATAQATLTLAPISGFAGSTASVSGAGSGTGSLAASTNVTIKFDGSTVITSPSPCTTNGGGNIGACSFTVPSSATPGAKTVTASDGTNTVPGSYTVVPPGALTTTTTSVTPGSIGNTIAFVY